MPGALSRPAIDAVLTTCPSPCAIMRGTKARIPWTTLQQVHAEDPPPFGRRQLPAVPRRAPRPRCCRGRAPPRTSRTCALRQRLDLLALGDVGPHRNRLDARRERSPRAPRRAGLSSTSARTSLIPSRAKRSAIARPMPLAAPVTTATLPFSSRISRLHALYTRCRCSAPSTSWRPCWRPSLRAAFASPSVVTAPTASTTSAGAAADSTAAPSVYAATSPPRLVSAPAAAPEAGGVMGPGPDAGVAAQFRACQSDSDCVTVPRARCCNNGWKEAVAASQRDAYAKAYACTKSPRPACPMYRIRDRRVAKCDTQEHLCVLAEP